MTPISHGVYGCIDGAEVTESRLAATRYYFLVRVLSSMYRSLRFENAQGEFVTCTRHIPKLQFSSRCVATFRTIRGTHA